MSKKFTASVTVLWSVRSSQSRKLPIHAATGCRHAGEDVIMQAAAELAGWKFEDARIFVKGGSIRGTLDGTVKYIHGKSGKVHMELEQEAGTWKLHSINLVTE